MVSVLLSLVFLFYLQMESICWKQIEFLNLVDILSGLPRLQMLMGIVVSKYIRNGGSSFTILLKVSAGSCYHNKMKLLCGKRLAKQVVIVPGKAIFMDVYIGICNICSLQAPNICIQISGTLRSS